MQTGDELTTWTSMVMTAEVRWTGEVKGIEGFYKSKRIKYTEIISRIG